MTDRPDKTDAEGPVPSATIVIEAFGGIRPMAAKLDIPVTTVQGWKERDSIPRRRWAEIRQAAAAQGLDLDALSGSGEPIALPPPAGDMASEAASAASSEAEAAETDSLAPLDDRPWAGSVPEDEAVAEQAPPEANEAIATAQPSATAEAAPMRPTASPPSRARRGMGLWPWLALAVLGGAVAVTWDLWWPMVGREAEVAMAPSPDISGATKEEAAPAKQVPAETAAPEAPAASAPGPSGDADLRALEAEIAGLKDAVSGLQGGGADGAAAERIAALEKQVQALTDSLKSRFAALEGGADAKGLESALAELRAENARLATLTETLGENVKALEGRLVAAERRTGAQETTMLAVGQLRAALARGTAFAEELRVLETVSSEDEAVAEAVAKLWPHAFAGVETEAALRARFEQLAPRVLSAEQATAGDWTGRLLAKLSDVVTVRRIGGEVEGEGSDAVLARTEARLQGGDLAGAVEAMGALQGAAAEAAQPWLAAARARLAADSALTALENKAMADSAAAAN